MRQGRELCRPACLGDKIELLTERGLLGMVGVGSVATGAAMRNFICHAPEVVAQHSSLFAQRAGPRS